MRGLLHQTLLQSATLAGIVLGFLPVIILQDLMGPEMTICHCALSVFHIGWHLGERTTPQPLMASDSPSVIQDLIHCFSNKVKR